MSSLVQFLFALLLLLTIPVSTPAAPGYKGMSITSWTNSGYRTPNAEQSIVNLQQIGTDTVAVNLFRVTTDSRISLGNYGASLSAVRHIIKYIHSQGMKVVLKPNVDISTGVWRAQWQPRDVDYWFQNVYQPFIMDIAALAAEENVAILSVGTEFNRLEKYDRSWRNLISTVRSIFPGQLTYAANHSPAAGLGGYQTLRWWDALDLVGIDAYFPLTNRNNPSLFELEKSWQTIAANITAWRRRGGINLPVIFTEVGYPSRSNGARYPWGQDANAEPNQDVQANSYAALLKVMSQQDWFQGAFWWMWEVDPLAGGPKDNNFTPQGKASQKILEKYYRPIPIGDANLDYQFDQFDLIQVLRAGKYLSGLAATWGEGDWNGLNPTAALPHVGDGMFDQLDIIALLQSSPSDSFNAVRRPIPNLPARGVPEPPGPLLAVIALVVLVYLITRNKHR